MDARARVRNLIDGAWTTQAIAAACELGVPERLQRGEGDVDALAVAIPADRDALERLLRGLQTLGLCSRDEAGRFALTADGRALVPGEPGSLAAWARMSGRRLWGNWGHLRESVRSGRSARSTLRGAEDFGDLDRDPTMARDFNAAMIDLTRPVAEAAARRVDWSGVSSALDVGGGSGALLAGLLQAHPAMHGAVLDMAHARDGAVALLEAEGLADRARFIEGSFFDAVPSGFDAYLLKSVLHNWDDARAGKILERCARAGTAGSRLVVVERIMPEHPGTAPADREAARSDLNMLVGCGGRERTLAEFAALLDAAGYAAETPVALTAEVSAIPARRR